MGKGITLSKKHGLNPSMTVCPICGKTVKNDEDIEEVMRDKGLILDDCYYMASESPIDIEEL